MSIRKKILLSFSAITILLIAVAFVFIYWLFSEYREEDFQQKQNVKINSTIQLLKRFKEETAEISSFLDAQDINDFYDEKLLVFDTDKELIFSSLDDLGITKRNQILNELSPAQRWIETKEGNYDLIGVYIERKGQNYYAISKAYDALGYDKLHFLGKVLLIIFGIIVLIVLFISFYLSHHLAKPIDRLASLLSHYDLNQEDLQPIQNDTSTKELKYLTERFNELLLRTQETFTFQKNTVNHISHQLKTPVTVLLSELEKMTSISDMQLMKAELTDQIERTKSLGDIITTILEIARIESGKNFHQSSVRIDELLFDVIEHLNIIYPDFNYHLVFQPEVFSENQMEVKGNDILLKHAFQNLLMNSALYSASRHASIVINAVSSNMLSVKIINDGKAITDEERKYLFHYFFRGKNSHGIAGNGLGLVLVQKIFNLHQSRISYSYNNNQNVFHITLEKNFN